jgi:hypothetical protein
MFQQKIPRLAGESAKLGMTHCGFAGQSDELIAGRCESSVRATRSPLMGRLQLSAIAVQRMCTCGGSAAMSRPPFNFVS